MRNGRLTGILTDRDVKLANSLQGVDPQKTLIDEIATDDAYLVSPDSPLDEVVAYMADHRIGSTLIVDNHKLVGIFTSTDALRVLGDTLHARH
jgi:IMP dehydrogenase/acetoin utilization protein AcuB